MVHHGSHFPQHYYFDDEGNALHKIVISYKNWNHAGGKLLPLQIAFNAFIEIVQ